MRLSIVLAVALGLIGVPAVAAPPAAQVTLITGQGTATAPAGNVRKLAKGDEVHAREMIATGPNTYLNLKFRDGGFIMLRPNSRMQIEAYAYETPAAPLAQDPAGSPAPAAPRPQAQQAYFSLFKGGFRAVTGLIGKANKEEYRFNTPVATIGIRGTDYVVILCDVACNSDPVIAASLQVGQQAAGGVVVGVIKGVVSVSAPTGAGTDVSENHYTMVLQDGSTVELPYEPRLLRVDPIPNPQACGG